MEKNIKEKIIIRNKLNELGICPIVGPTGPTGPKGERGEKGDKGGLVSYGERYLHSTKTISVNQFSDTIIPLDTNGNILNADFTVNNAINIKEKGIYRVNYFAFFTPSEDVSYSIFVKGNNTILAGSDISKSATANEKTYVTGTVIGEFNVGDHASIYIKTNKTINITFSEGTSAKISIIKLD